MKKLHTLLALGLALGLAACNEQQTSVMQPAAKQTAAANSDTSKVLATVNGQPITENTVEVHLQQRNLRRPGDAGNQDRNLALQEVINLELMTQAAERSGIADRPDVSAQLRHTRRALLSSIAVQEYMSQNPASEEKTHALYDERFGTPSQEYKARHILLKTEEDARKMIAELDGGADFAELAKEHSTGPTGPRGGDLGWFSSSQMVAPFSEAVAQLENGSYTKEPVKTQFGWHVILREDSREATPPAYDDIKDQLQMVVQNQALQEYLDQLRQDAKIDIKDGAAE